MRDISDELIRKAQAGDIEAFEGIYRHYSPGVYLAALKIMHNEADAQDVTQEVFITLFHKLENFRFESALKTWVYRIAINTALNMRKKQMKLESPQVEFIEELAVGTNESEVNIQADKDYNLRIVAFLLDKLNAEQKACLVLRSIEGFSYEEIAETLNININTVRSRIRRARQTLLSLKKEVMANEL